MGTQETTRYRDYAISRELFHWESQCTTSADGRTGQRYQHHGEQGAQVVLFARVRDTDPAFRFLGPCEPSREGSPGGMADEITALTPASRTPWPCCG